MGAAIAAIATVAASFGIQHVIDLINRLKARSRGLTQDQIITRLKAIINQMVNADSRTLNALTARINDLPDASRLIASKAVDAIQTRRKNLQADISKVEDRMRSADVLNERVASYAYQPESYKLSEAGSRDLTSIEKAVKNLAPIKTNSIK